jgi:hypothetical protein
LAEVQDLVLTLLTAAFLVALFTFAQRAFMTAEIPAAKPNAGQEEVSQHQGWCYSSLCLHSHLQIEDQLMLLSSPPSASSDEPIEI